MSHESDNIELILEKWGNIQEFLDNVFNSNPQKNENRIEDSVLLYMIKKLKERSYYEKESAESIYLEDEENEENRKLFKEWTNVNNSLSDIQTICDNLRQEMDKLN